MLPEKQKAHYRAFYDSARYNDILNPKTTLMLHLANLGRFGTHRMLITPLGCTGRWEAWLAKLIWETIPSWTPGKPVC